MINSSLLFFRSGIGLYPANAGDGILLYIECIKRLPGSVEDFTQRRRLFGIVTPTPIPSCFERSP